MSVSSAPLIWRLGLFAALWFILCSGELRSWPFGLPTVILATWLNLQLAGPAESPAIRPLVLLGFIPFFVGKSILSGVDVLRRVVHPRLPINPGLVTCPLTIDHPAGRIFLANSITLLPGTISARLKDSHLIVHTLDKGLAVTTIVADLERRIASLYQPHSVTKSDRGVL